MAPRFPPQSRIPSLLPQKTDVLWYPREREVEHMDDELSREEKAFTTKLKEIKFSGTHFIPAGLSKPFMDMDDEGEDDEDDDEEDDEEEEEEEDEEEGFDMARDLDDDIDNDNQSEQDLFDRDLDFDGNMDRDLDRDLDDDDDGGGGGDMGRDLDLSMDDEHGPSTDFNQHRFAYSPSPTLYPVSAHYDDNQHPDRHYNYDNYNDYYNQTSDFRREQWSEQEYEEQQRERDLDADIEEAGSYGSFSDMEDDNDDDERIYGQRTTYRTPSPEYE